MIKEEIKRQGISATIATLIGIITLIGTIYAVSARYSRLDAGYDQNIKEHSEIKQDTSEKYAELKKEMAEKFAEQQKQNVEIIRALGRIEGKLEQ